VGWADWLGFAFFGTCSYKVRKLDKDAPYKNKKKQQACEPGFLFFL